VPYLFPKAGGLRLAAVRKLAQLAGGVIVTNSEDCAVMQAWLAGRSPAQALRQIPIGSNIDVYTPNHIEVQEVREQLGLAGDAFLLGYFGFLNESKGAETLVTALSKLEAHYHLLFLGGQAGDSDRANNEQFLAELRAQVAALGLARRVHWTGYLSPLRVSAHLHAADLLVMPYRDGASLRRGTLMAALAHGRPLLTTIPQTPTPELQHGQNVWLVAAGDAAALAGAIRRLAGDAATRNALAREARLLSRLFSWERIATETAALYQTLR
jgi:glycosyltransferase involved in cell wall biosynthesis